VEEFEDPDKGTKTTMGDAAITFTFATALMGFFLIKPVVANQKAAAEMSAEMEDGEWAQDEGTQTNDEEEYGAEDAASDEWW